MDASSAEDAFKALDVHRKVRDQLLSLVAACTVHSDVLSGVREKSAFLHGAAGVTSRLGRRYPRITRTSTCRGDVLYLTAAQQFLHVPRQLMSRLFRPQNIFPQTLSSPLVCDDLDYDVC